MFAVDLKVRTDIGSSDTGVMALQVRLEGVVAALAGTVFLAQCFAGKRVVILVGMALLATPQSPCNECKGTNDDGASNTANHASDDLLGVVAEARAARGISALTQLGRICRSGGASSVLDSAAGGDGGFDGLTAASGEDGCHVLLYLATDKCGCIDLDARGCGSR